MKNYLFTMTLVCVCFLVGACEKNDVYSNSFVRAECDVYHLSAGKKDTIRVLDGSPNFKISQINVDTITSADLELTKTLYYKVSIAAGHDRLRSTSGDTLIAIKSDAIGDIAEATIKNLIYLRKIKEGNKNRSYNAFEISSLQSTAQNYAVTLYIEADNKESKFLPSAVKIMCNK